MQDELQKKDEQFLEMQQTLSSVLEENIKFQAALEALRKEKDEEVEMFKCQVSSVVDDNQCTWLCIEIQSILLGCMMVRG